MQLHPCADIYTVLGEKGLPGVELPVRRARIAGSSRRPDPSWTRLSSASLFLFPLHLHTLLESVSRLLLPRPPPVNPNRKVPCLRLSSVLPRFRRRSLTPRVCSPEMSQSSPVYVHLRLGPAPPAPCVPLRTAADSLPPCPPHLVHLVNRPRRASVARARSCSPRRAPRSSSRTSTRPRPRRSSTRSSSSEVRPSPSEET